MALAQATRVNLPKLPRKGPLARRTATEAAKKEKVDQTPVNERIE